MHFLPLLTHISSAKVDKATLEIDLAIPSAHSTTLCSTQGLPVWNPWAQLTALEGNSSESSLKLMYRQANQTDCNAMTDVIIHLHSHGTVCTENGCCMSIYADSYKAHLCILVASRVGMPCLGPRILVNSLWFMTMVNIRPYKYWWNLWIPKMRESVSFSICAYFLSAGESALEAKAIGHSVPSDIWEMTAPTP